MVVGTTMDSTLVSQLASCNRLQYFFLANIALFVVWGLCGRGRRKRESEVRADCGEQPGASHRGQRAQREGQAPERPERPSPERPAAPQPGSSGSGPSAVGSLRGKSKTNLRHARQRVEMRDTPCYDAPATAYACSIHTEAPPEASSGLLSHGRVPRLAP